MKFDLPEKEDFKFNVGQVLQHLNELYSPTLVKKTEQTIGNWFLHDELRDNIRKFDTRRKFTQTGLDSIVFLFDAIIIRKFTFAEAILMWKLSIHLYHHPADRQFKQFEK